MRTLSLKALYQSGATGMAVWAAYGTVEALFGTVLPSTIFAESYMPPSRAFLLALVLGYPAAGAAIGAVLVAGRALITRNVVCEAPAKRVHVACLAAVVALNALTLAPRTRLFVLFVCLIVAFAARRRLDFIANEWTASLLAIAPLCAVVEISGAGSLAWNAAASAITAAIILAGAYALSRTARGVPAFVPLLSFVLVTSVALVPEGPAPRQTLLSAAPALRSLPNIVVISLDTVRADHLSLYGYRRGTTPQLEIFGRGATVYERAYSPSNATLPVHASLFTARWPSEHGAMFNGRRRAWQPLASDITPFPELLDRRGYATASIAANYTFLGNRFGLARGFQYLDARPPRTAFGQSQPYYLRARVAQLLDIVVHPPATVHRLTRTAAEINASVGKQLDRFPSDRPFLLFVNYMDAHSICVPPEPYASMFPGRDRHQRVDSFQRLMVDVMDAKATSVTLTPEEQRHLISQYDGAIAYVDTMVGDLLQMLRSRRLFDNTLVIITADHGEAFGVRGIIGHGSSAYDDQIRVPLVVKAPRQSVPSVSSDPVSTILLYDLVLDAAGIRPLSQAPHRPVVAEAFPYQGPSVSQSLVHSGQAVLQGRYKLIDNYDAPSELYDVVADPEETRNLIAHAGSNSIVTVLRKNLHRWNEWGAEARDRAVIGGPDREIQLRLRSLGYVH